MIKNEAKTVAKVEPKVESDTKRGTQLMTVVNGDLNVRESPDLNSRVIEILHQGQKIEVGILSAGFYKLANRPGYIKADFVK